MVLSTASVVVVVAARTTVEDDDDDDADDEEDEEEGEEEEEEGGAQLLFATIARARARGTTGTHDSEAKQNLDRWGADSTASACKQEQTKTNKST